MRKQLSRKNQLNNIWDSQRLQAEKKQHLHNAKPSILKSRIIADSTCSRIRKNDIDEIIDTRQEEVSINKFPNAEADEILHYSQYHLVKDCPDNIVIVAGLNDLLHSEDRANADCKLIADKVIKIGRVAREKGVARVCISGLVKPKYYNCRAPVDTINGYLMDNCSREGFVYLDQGNIQASDMGDMVHVGNQGLSKLRDNIYKGLFTYSSSSANGRDRDWLDIDGIDQQSNDQNIDISLKEYRTKNSENLIIGSLNINSLRNKVDQLRLLVK